MENLSRNTLLIIDDSEINRSSLRTIFKGQYNIEEASDGREGLQFLLENKDNICAVLLDLIMPVMDGMEVLKIANASGLMQTIPVFLITAESRDEVLKEAYTMGVMDIILKPFVPYMIERRINSVIELFSSRRQLSDEVIRQQSEIVRQSQQILNMNMGMVEALATAIEFRSGESGSHIRRIRSITKLMLEQTDLGNGLSPEEIRQIAHAAMMHDVGKIAISDSILNKPGKLTAEEYEIMKEHTVRGAELLEKIPQMRDQKGFRYAVDIARHHHERWDGNGYPDGLVGDEISLWAQVVSVADVYDALVSKRVYKDAYSIKTAVEMICSGECGVFNPRVLTAFIKVEKRIKWFYGDD
ncbi:MAG: HD domain-containing phosphohydrolase [Huintestinicola sp.]